jgi:hypothetical protein
MDGSGFIDTILAWNQSQETNAPEGAPAARALQIVEGINCHILALRDES